MKRLTKSYIPTFTRTLAILLFGQAIAGSVVPVLFLIDGLLGPSLAPNLKWATLPISLVVVGIALASPISTWIMSKIGRKQGHVLGLSFSLAGLCIAGLALSKGSFWGLTLGNFLAGIGGAFNNQIRFSAAESTTDEKALVHSWVLMFSLVAAILGPGLIQLGHSTFPGEYVGSVVMMASLILVLILAMMWLPHFQPVQPLNTSKTPIARSDVLYSLAFWRSAAAGIVAFATMTMLMTATPIQMHSLCHFTHQATTNVIQCHIIAMYFPSLFSGFLLSRLGNKKLVALGVALYAICIGIAATGHSLHHYWWALVLLGIGWNFLFLSGSTGISQNFTGPERFFAQGFNDSLVYGTQAVASLCAGWCLFALGWQTMVWLPIPLLLILMGITFVT